MEQEAQAQMAEAQANAALGQAIGRGVHRMFTSHQDDAAGVILDIICIAASIALIPTGLGFLGIAALAGGAVLLGCDGAAYAMEVGGDDERAERIKKDTEWIRLAATIVTLPDFGWNGIKAIRELRELRELRAMAATTGQAAQRLGNRATNAARAARYEQITARANLRTQIRTQQIRASLRLEMAPRGVASASMGLLLREEVQGDESAMHQVNRWLKVHLTAAHK